MFKYFALCIHVLFALCFVSTIHAAPKKTEAELVAMLDSTNYLTVQDALDRLPKWYPNSPGVVEKIKGILRRKEPLIAEGRIRNSLVATNLLVRKAARSLGEYHADLGPDDLQIIIELLHNHDPDTVMDGLKALRGLKAPGAAKEIRPLLQDSNGNVVRDACRTLAVLGTKDDIPAIEPLLKRSRVDVVQDAEKAISQLKNRN
jgi:HEAT repeat protein